MKKLANIVIKGKKNVFGNIYNVVNNCEQIDDTLPTLYIGLEQAKKCIDGFNILKKYYPNQNCWWTFSKTERRNDYITDVQKFQTDIILKVLSEVKYEYVDFIRYTRKRLVKFIKYIKSNNNKICFVTKGSNFIFIYDVKIKCEFGLSLTLCEYCGIDRYKVINHIKENKYNHFIYDMSFLTSETRRIIGDNTHYVLPLYDYFKD